MFHKEIYIQSLSVAAYSRKKGCIFRQKAELRKNTLICVLSGRISVQIKGCTHFASAGELLYIPAATASVTSFLEVNNRFVNFIFKCDAYLSDSLVHFSGNRIIEQIAEETEKRYLTTSGSHIYYLSAFYRILSELETQETTLSNPRFTKLLPVLRRIEQHPEENVKISEYAAEVYMCETGFRRLFKEYTGKSPIDYRNGIRLQRIENLLQAGETATNAAANLGFQSISFYYRCLRNYKNSK